jgi:hypothetical protein
VKIPIWLIFQLYSTARLSSNRQVVSLPTGLYILPWSIGSYPLIISLALYSFEPLGFLVVVNNHFDPIGIFTNCACAGEQVLFGMIELYSPLIAGSYFLFGW